jgi:hypothetical protein
MNYLRIHMKNIIILNRPNNMKNITLSNRVQKSISQSSPTLDLLSSL